jgi:hypothetical protein
MPDDPGRDAAFYDHENEPRRHVADWGGDDVFARVPRRRPVHSTPPQQHHRRPSPLDPLHRAASEASGRSARTDEVGSAPADSPEGSGRLDRSAREASGGEGRFARGDGAAAQSEDAMGRDGRFVRTDEALADGGVGGGERKPAPGSPDDLLAAAARARGFVVRAPQDPSDDAPSDDIARGGSPRRRQTVVITGRPDGVARPRPQRSRPPRTVADRVGPRPERIVAWAFALGLLLILIAIATADAATL